MSDDRRHSFEIGFPSGASIYAWFEDKKGDPRIAVQWREPSGKPAHQPFWLNLYTAPNVLEQLAAFARHVQVEMEE